MMKNFFNYVLYAALLTFLALHLWNDHKMFHAMLSWAQQQASAPAPAKPPAP